MFLLLHFLLAQKLLEGLWRDSPDSSIRALTISWALKYSLLSFLEHMSLFSTHNNWGWNMQGQLESCQTRFTFSLWPPPLLSSSWFLFTSTHWPFFYQKTKAEKKLSHKFFKVLKSNAFEFDLNSQNPSKLKEKSSDFLTWFSSR